MTRMAWIEWRRKPPPLPTLRNDPPLLRPLFLLLTLAVFVLLPLLSLDAGLSGDDEKHYQHALKVHRYFRKGTRPPWTIRPTN
ncbi:MAG: hypothetical protein R2751_02200 [Bacteroidales bacterium]